MSEIKRFIDAQTDVYLDALNEIRKGRKRSHWMWFIFPQISGLGHSSTAKYYAIKDLSEAREYLENEVLGKRLIEITSELLKLGTNDPVIVFGSIDALKLKSCMTLFELVSDDEVFGKVLEKFYDGKRDDLTLNICSNMGVDNIHI